MRALVVRPEDRGRTDEPRQRTLATGRAEEAGSLLSARSSNAGPTRWRPN